MNFFIKDPKTKEPSVSLSMLVVSFLALLIASLFHVAKMTEHTSSLTELFGICSGLYFGRRVQLKSGSTLDAGPNETGNK